MINLIFLTASLMTVSLFVFLLWKKFLFPDKFGVANWITFSRNLLVVLIVNILMLDYGENENTAIMVLSLIVLSMDGLDGYFARKLNICSDFGARFDMESDAMFILVLCVVIVLEYQSALWILLIGGMRYFYVMAQSFFPALSRPVKDRYSRKVICVIQIVALIVPLTGLVSESIYLPILALSLALLIFSFGRDIVDQISDHKAEVKV